MDHSSLNVIYEDNHLLAVDKPAGLATMGTPPGKPTLLDLAKLYVKDHYNKPGNVYLGVISRLDAPVTGVVLLARTSKAARRLTEQFRSRTVGKTYWTIVEGLVRSSSGKCVNWLVKDERHRRMHVVDKTVAGAKEARLSYRRLAKLDGLTLLEVQLETGRKHQIRLQLSHIGHPVLGDRKYGARMKFPNGIALHSHTLRLTHPVRDEPLELESPLPPSWAKFGVAN
jgi:23S rRNA pseudouridine1911/1915/1917 synthase